MTPQTELSQVTTAVTEARRALAEGHVVDLAGLESAVAQVCAQASEIPQGERPLFAERLTALADALDLLAADIARFGATAQRRRAADAYGEGA